MVKATSIQAHDALHKTRLFEPRWASLAAVVLKEVKAEEELDGFEEREPDKWVGN